MWTLRTVCLAGVFCLLGACSSSVQNADDDDNDDNDNNDDSVGSGGRARGGTPGSTTENPSTSGGTRTTTAQGGTGQGGSSGNVGSPGGAETGGAETGGLGYQGGRACADIDASTSAKPVVLELVIDKTGSFNDDAYPNDPTRDSTKWTEMQWVLPEAIRKLPPRWAVGTTYFSLSGNTSDAGVCYEGAQATEIGELTPEHVEALIGSIPTQCAGATPTLAAWQFGLGQLSAWQAPAEYAESPRVIVLITDGIPTVKNNGCFGGIVCPVDWEPPSCAEGEVVRSNGAYAISEAEYDRSIALVKDQGEAANISTYVVGVLGSENGQGAGYDPLYKLSQLAMAGGTSKRDCEAVPGTMTVVSGQESSLTERGTYCHLDMTAEPDFAEGLRRALKSVVTSLIDCTYTVPKPRVNDPVDFDRTEVIYYPGGSDPSDPNAGVRLYQHASGELDSSCPEETGPDAAPGNAGIGWYYSQRNPTLEPLELKLCPGSCDMVRKDLDAQLKVTFVCIDVG